MLSVIIATHDSERALVATLATLVPGATAGIVREVIVTDGGSKDDTEQVADIAGCRFLLSNEALGARLKTAAETARGTWLMFLQPGVVPGPSWIDETIAFVDQTERKGEPRAAVFAPERPIPAILRVALRMIPHPDQGLIVPAGFYKELGGHRDPVAHKTFLRRIGRRRIVTLRTTVTKPDI